MKKVKKQFNTIIVPSCTFNFFQQLTSLYKRGFLFVVGNISVEGRDNK